MIGNLDGIRIKEPRFLLMYSALQFAPVEQAKPDGALSLAYVAGALRRAHYDVSILDVAVGGPDDRLEDTFFKPTPLPSGMNRVGLAPERIVQYLADYDVIGLNSTFTTQTTMVIELARLVKMVAPEKLMIAGGITARNMRARFFDAGVDVIALGEAERTIVEIAEAVRGVRRFSEIRGIAFRDDTGREIVNPPAPVIENLDDLPIPAWDLLPNDKYWDISRPHGGQFPPGKRLTYASLQTSRGCPFQCLYCHISRETTSDVSGPLGKLRLKSIDRVLQEMQTLKDLGTQYLFFEDDSLFAKKKRAYTLFKLAAEMKLTLLDVNGINICHLQKNFGGHLGIDVEFLEVLGQAGFEMLTLPFESANQRLIDKYATAKWQVDSIDTKALIRACLDAGIRTAGNYMIGYPDETLDEIHNTMLMAKRHVEIGMNHGHFFAVVPFPGTALFDMVIANGQLDPDFDPDNMKWTRSILKNLAVPADTLEHMRQLAWLMVNRADFVNYKIAMRVQEQSGVGEVPGVPSAPATVPPAPAGAPDLDLMMGA